MKLHVVDTGFFKLDGGAMFGVVPNKLWKKINPPDENNMCTWAMRCLLIEDGKQKILIDTGMGDKQNDKFRSHFEPHGGTSLEISIRNIGFEPEEITDVILTHLHFDHVGGAVYRDSDFKLKPLFPNAKYWTNKIHFDWAVDPNYREKASFLKENFVPLYEANQLHFIDVEDGISFNENISFKFYYGHTEALMVPYIKLPGGQTLVYTADLLPSAGHARMPYVMSYDIRPLETLKDKARFYEEANDPNYVIYFEHDKDHILGHLIKDSKSRYNIDTSINFKDLIL